MTSQLHGSLQNFVGGGSGQTTQADLLMAHYTSGMQLHGRMSAVRRFFCLFVTFDLCFTSLFWVICILLGGDSIEKAFANQIIGYSFQTSLFDIVVCSFARFLLLILFYATIHISHWWLVAIVTALSCAFLIAKSLMYSWDKSNSNDPFEVMLVLISFFIAWTEAWFIDFRVLPQEARAKSIVEVAGGTNEERSDERYVPPIERVRDYLSQYTESVANFYSPIESPAGSDDEDFYVAPKKLSHQESEYILCGEEALRQSWETVNSGGWNHEKTISHTDIIFSKKCIKGYKIYKLMAVVEISPEALFHECLHNFESIPQWNKAITKSKLIQVINNKTDIIYQIAAEGPGGVVSQRDFVNVRHWNNMTSSWIISGMSVVHSDVPVYKNMVRGENGPTCLVFSGIDDHPERCALQWLLDIDLKGWIPKYVLEQALIHAITDFLASIKAFTPILRERNRSASRYDP